jgi:hypothetical protein
MTQLNIYVLEGGASSSLAHWSGIFLEIRHQFHTSVLLSHWILTNQQTSNWNLESVFWIYVMLFQSSDTFHKEFFRVTLPYLLVNLRECSLFFYHVIFCCVIRSWYCLYCMHVLDLTQYAILSFNTAAHTSFSACVHCRFDMWEAHRR